MSRMRRLGAATAVGVALFAGASRVGAGDRTGERSFDDVLESLRARSDSTLHATTRRVDAAHRDSVLAAFDAGLAAGGFPDSLAPDPVDVGRRDPLRVRFELDPQRASLDYSKVDGASLHLRPRLHVRASRIGLVLGGRVGYAFGSNRGRHSLGVRIQTDLATLGVDHVRGTRAFGWTEIHGHRTLALFGTDELDHLEARGLVAFAERRVGDTFRVRLGFRRTREGPRGARDVFTFLGPDAAAAANVPAERGEVRAFSLGVLRPREEAPSLHGEVFLETAGGGLGGDFDYERAGARVTHERKLPWDDALLVELRAQAASGDGGVPIQAQGDPFGRSGVRGYPHRHRSGTHALLARIGYRLGRDVFQRARVPLLSRLALQLAPFVDLGAAWSPRPSRWPPGGAWRWGAGLSIRRYLGFGQLLSHVRLDAARRLDRSRAAPVFYVVLEGEPLD